MGQVKLNNGNVMPNFGYGTWQIIFGVRKKVLRAIDEGYRLIDTAKIYGNEVGVGAAIHDAKFGRSELFVTTKLWNGDQGYDSAHQAFNDSLERLGLDYIDLYLIHWPGHDPKRRADSWRALEEIYKSGKAKNIGVSNYMAPHLEELLATAKVKPAVNQIELHPYIYHDQEAIVNICKDNEIIVEAYSPLAHGRHINDLVVNQIAKEHQASTAQVMLAWALHKGTVPIPKTTSFERMQENFDSQNLKLTDEDIKQLDNLSRSEHVVDQHY